MERFKRYLNRPFRHERLKMSETLGDLRVSGRYLPDPPEVFDEFEFATLFEGFPNAGFTVAVENTIVKRIMFGTFDPDDPDAFRPMSVKTLAAFLDQHGEELEGFFDFITRSE